MFTQVDRSSRRAQGGLGIGLTLVRSLVAMHGGHVEARSEGLGKGSEFVVELSVVDEGVRDQSTASPEQFRGGGSWWWTTTAMRPTRSRSC